jgi:hypothetical protein
MRNVDIQKGRSLQNAAIQLRASSQKRATARFAVALQGAET